MDLRRQDFSQFNAKYFRMEKDETECGETLVKKKTISQDQVTSVIGEVGRWQLEKILIVFLASAPGEECRNS